MRRKLQTLPGNVNSKLGHPRVGGGGQIRRGPEREMGGVDVDGVVCGMGSLDFDGET